MGFNFILACTVLYVCAAINFAYKRLWLLSIMYAGYAIANIGCLGIAWIAERNSK